MVKLNQAAYDHAVKMIKQGFEVLHDKDNWEEVKPTHTEATNYLNNHGLEQYGSWFLGINEEADQNDRSKYEYPYGDFKVVQESALIASKRKAGEHHAKEILEAADRLLALIEENKG